MNKQQEFILKEYKKLERQRLKLMLDEAKRVKEEEMEAFIFLNTRQEGQEYSPLDAAVINHFYELAKILEAEKGNRFILDCPCGSASFESREQAENYLKDKGWPCGCKPEIREIGN